VQNDFLFSLVIIFGFSAVAVFLLNKLKIPSIIGFLFAGIIIGPFGLSLIKDVEAIEFFAEIGVILLLFTLGIEFSLKKLLRIKKIVFGAGAIQMIGTIVASGLIAWFFLENSVEALLTGFLVSLSSTAIILKILATKNEIHSIHGRAMIAVSLFQDLFVVILMILIPVLSGDGIDKLEVLYLFLKALLIIVFVVFGAKWVIPYIFNHIIKTKSRELFIITIILFCVGTALLTSQMGLSLSLGAFLAGMLISESEYAYQATSEILPFKESFMGLFFVSIGMLLNTIFVLDNIGIIIIIVLSVILLKSIIAYLSLIAVNLPIRNSIIGGLGLAQVGEFSFILALAGRAAGIISDDIYQIFLASSIFSMIASPFIMNASPNISVWLINKFSPFHFGEHSQLAKKERESDLVNHVIIIGYGFNGKNLARILNETDIPYIVIDSNFDTVKKYRQRDENIFYGDASGRDLLKKYGAKKARLLVSTVSDPISQRMITSIARSTNPCLHIIVRTRYVSSVDELKQLGANDVIPEEFETSIELFVRTLILFRFPPSVIESMTNKVRTDNYAVLRSKELPRKTLFHESDCLPKIEIDGYHIPESSKIINNTIKELNIRQQVGVTILAIRRGKEVLLNPEPNFIFSAHDIVLFTGDRDSMDKAIEYFKSLSEANNLDEKL